MEQMLELLKSMQEKMDARHEKIMAGQPGKDGGLADRGEADFSGEEN
jgi:hypothetical protein